MKIFDTILRALVGLLIIFAIALPATASEIWVSPISEDDNRNVGDWAVTQDGNARFAFSVPDNMKAFIGAYLVVIGNRSTTISYDLHLSVSMDGKAHDDMKQSITDQRFVIKKNNLTEIDISALFPADLLPGHEYVSLHFDTFKKESSVKVVGLRFIYNANADNIVTSLDIEDNSITSADIEDNSVASVDITDGSISGADIQDNTVSGADITNNSITGTDIQTNTVTSSDVKDGSLTGADIQDNTITGDDITNGSLTGADIQNNSITNVDILNEAGIDYDNAADQGYRGLGQRKYLSTEWTDIHVIQLTMPAPGIVTCIATGAFDWLDNKEIFARVGWSLESGDRAPLQYNFSQPEQSSSDGPELAVSTIYTFNMWRGGTEIFRLKASQFTGEPKQVSYWRQSAACMYFPTRL